MFLNECEYVCAFQGAHAYFRVTTTDVKAQNEHTISAKYSSAVFAMLLGQLGILEAFIFATAFFQTSRFLAIHLWRRDFTD